jgi:hypothetical protein
MYFNVLRDDITMKDTGINYSRLLILAEVSSGWIIQEMFA